MHTPTVLLLRKFLLKAFPSLLIITVIALNGCGSSIKFTSVQPKPEDIVGKYEFTPETVNLVNTANYVLTNTPSITFYADGRFEMLNMPGCWLEEPLRSYDGQPVARSFDSGNGVWRIVDLGVKGYPPTWGIILNFSDTKSVISWRRKIPISFGRLMLINEQSPYLLHIIVGDPDDDQGLEFNKVETLQK
ncbi:MAG TPA: hypothetical protein VGI63_00390 [Verrucomicrobiae bacterium]|jgi:hypothetical protein